MGDDLSDLDAMKMVSLKPAQMMQFRKFETLQTMYLQKKVDLGVLEMFWNKY